LLEKGDVNLDVVFCGGGGVDVDLGMLDCGILKGSLGPYFALGVEKFDSSSSRSMGNAIVFAFLVIAHCIEAVRGRCCPRGVGRRG
jgi:hypothetical protein